MLKEIEYKNTKKNRIPLKKKKKKTEIERKANAFEQKSIPHPYIKVRMGDVGISSLLFPLIFKHASKFSVFSCQFRNRIINQV